MNKKLGLMAVVIGMVALFGTPSGFAVERTWTGRVCTLSCADGLSQAATRQEETQYVLVGRGRVFAIENQNTSRIRQHEGEYVKVSGEMAPSGRGIRVTRVDVLEDPGLDATGIGAGRAGQDWQDRGASDMSRDHGRSTKRGASQKTASDQSLTGRLCSLSCGEGEGGEQQVEHVLVDRGRIFMIENQDLEQLEEHAGDRVRLTGTVDPAARSILVIEVEEAGVGSAVEGGTAAERDKPRGSKSSQDTYGTQQGQQQGQSAERPRGSSRATAPAPGMQGKTWTGRLCRLGCGPDSARLQQGAAGAYGAQQQGTTGAPGAQVQQGAQAPMVQFVLVDRGRIYAVEAPGLWTELDRHSGQRVKVMGDLTPDGRAIRASRVESTGTERGAMDRGSAVERGTAAERGTASGTSTEEGMPGYGQDSMGATGQGGRTLTGRLCTLGCPPESMTGQTRTTQEGAEQFVLIDRNRVYAIESANTSELQPHIGHQVRLTGEMTPDGRAFRVTRLEMVAAGDLGAGQDAYGSGSAVERGTAAERGTTSQQGQAGQQGTMAQGTGGSYGTTGAGGYGSSTSGSEYGSAEPRPAMSLEEKTISGRVCSCTEFRGASDEGKSRWGWRQECAEACATHADADYVLVDGGKSYRIENQDSADLAEHAGKKVKVTGTLDEQSGTIRVTEIEKRGWRRGDR